MGLYRRNKITAFTIIMSHHTTWSNGAPTHTGILFLSDGDMTAEIK